MLRQKTYSINKKEANEMLQNIFEACDTAPNTVSFDTLLLRTKANTTLVTTCKWIATIFLVLVIFSPLAFHTHENVTLTNSEHTEISVTSHHLYKDHFEMTLSGSDIDYGAIYCKKLDGTVVIPTISSEAEQIVEIPFDGESLNIYIPCTDGRVIQALLSK